jgi:hypothetical protein
LCALPAVARCCGEGDLAQMKQRIGNEPSVVFAGWLDHTKLLALMSMSDLGVAPITIGPIFGVHFPTR